MPKAEVGQKTFLEEGFWFIRTGSSGAADGGKGSMGWGLKTGFRKVT